MINTANVDTATTD